MKNLKFIQNPILLACALIAGGANAQSITFSGDTFPSGDFDGRQDLNQSLIIGDLDIGNLALNAGAVLNTGLNQTTIGQTAGSTGTVTISDGSQLNASQMYISRSGNAALNILRGGKLVSHHAYIGQSVGGTGLVTVDGPGSSWSISPETTGGIAVGLYGGTGTLRVINGGTVSVHNSLLTSRDSASTGHIEIDGANSSLQVAKQCALGPLGATSIKITNRGLFRCGQDNYLHSGVVSLSGAGSMWVVGSDLDVGNKAIGFRGARGERGEKAELNIGDGSVVELAGNLRLAVDSYNAWGGSGTLNIEGAGTPGVLKAQNVVFGNYGVSVINFKHSDSSGNYIFTPSISGTGSINAIGTGTTVLAGNNTHSGQSSIQSGVLRAGSAAALGSASYDVSRGGTLDMNRFSPALVRLRNAGTVILGEANTSAVATANSYRGYGGNIHLNAALGGSNSATQKMVVTWDTSGTSTLHIRNLGGTGAQTTGNGILVVQVGLESNGQFTLPAPGYIQAGAYRYTLHKVGRNWYLQSAPANAKAAAADDSAACVADPLAQGCALAAGQGAVAKALPAALKAGTANAAAAAEAEAAAPTADASAQREAALGADDLKDDGAVGFTGAVPVPGLGMVGMVSLSSLIGVAGLRRSRKAV
ncbi:autotransporter outer membrane beta-barrel domain-containing protein [Comamonas sp.]|uniref:autotransporter outer membrane beta-barrel domain-containing protein n=1 Tax=Comamonas sp. TaxID=34028 RepID=UPI00289767EE|nr:autotransporter outer membrane beta-barrel domain-containing protein [Comamonas sp.]